MPPRSQSAPRAARPDPEPSSAGDQQYRVVVKVHAVAFEPDCPNGSFAVTLERPGGGKSVTSRNVNPAWPLLSTDKLESGWTGQAGRHVFEADVPEHTQVYSGPFQDGQRHGPNGLLRFGGGEWYVGDWANDTYHGHGRFVSAEGVYEGGHFEGEWEGYGVYRWANGDVYDGQFEGNERHGLGRKLYADGRVEEGLWQHDEFVPDALREMGAHPSQPAALPDEDYVGLGRCVNADSDTYLGPWRLGKRHTTEGEHGVQYFANGDRYVGEWCDDHFEGQGCYRLQSAEESMRGVYEGTHLGGEWCGHGTFTWNDGRHYEGEFVNWKCEGWGTMTDALGIQREGLWSQDAFLGRRASAARASIASGEPYSSDEDEDEDETAGADPLVREAHALALLRASQLDMVEASLPSIVELAFGKQELSGAALLGLVLAPMPAGGLRLEEVLPKSAAARLVASGGGRGLRVGMTLHQVQRQSVAGWPAPEVRQALQRGLARRELQLTFVCPAVAAGTGLGAGSQALAAREQVALPRGARLAWPRVARGLRVAMEARRQVLKMDVELSLLTQLQPKGKRRGRKSSGVAQEREQGAVVGVKDKMVVLKVCELTARRLRASSSKKGGGAGAGQTLDIKYEVLGSVQLNLAHYVATGTMPVHGGAPRACVIDCTGSGDKASAARLAQLRVIATVEVRPERRMHKKLSMEDAARQVEQGVAAAQRSAIAAEEATAQSQRRYEAAVSEPRAGGISLREAFSLFDVDQDGALNLTQCHSVLECLGCAAPSHGAMCTWVQANVPAPEEKDLAQAGVSWQQGGRTQTAELPLLQLVHVLSMLEWSMKAPEKKGAAGKPSPPSSPRARGSGAARSAAGEWEPRPEATGPSRSRGAPQQQQKLAREGAWEGEDVGTVPEPEVSAPAVRPRQRTLTWQAATRRVSATRWMAEGAKQQRGAQEAVAAAAEPSLSLLSAAAGQDGGGQGVLRGQLAKSKLKTTISSVMAARRLGQGRRGADEERGAEAPSLSTLEEESGGPSPDWNRASTSRHSLMTAPPPSRLGDGSLRGTPIGDGWGGTGGMALAGAGVDGDLLLLNRAVMELCGAKAALALAETERDTARLRMLQAERKVREGEAAAGESRASQQETNLRLAQAGFEIQKLALALRQERRQCAALNRRLSEEQSKALRARRYGDEDEDEDVDGGEDGGLFLEGDDAVPLNARRGDGTRARRPRVHARIVGEYDVGPASRLEDADRQAHLVPKKPVVRELIRDAMNNTKLFQHLHPSQHKMIIDCMERKEFAQGDLLVSKRQATARYFVLESGQCVVESSDGDCLMLARGSAFGEAALVHETISSRVIRARSKCIFWSMERRAYRDIVMRTTKERKESYEALLTKVDLLAQITPAERSLVADCLMYSRAQAGEDIMRFGDKGDFFYIIVKGTCTVLDQSGTEVAQREKGDYFGELALLNDAPRTATIRAASACEFARIDKKTFVRLVGEIGDLNIRDYQHASGAKAGAVARSKHGAAGGLALAGVAKIPHVQNSGCISGRIPASDCKAAAFEFVRHLGASGPGDHATGVAGTAGMVSLLRYKANQKCCTLKALRKQQLLRSGSLVPRLQGKSALAHVQAACTCRVGEAPLSRSSSRGGKVKGGADKEAAALPWLSGLAACPFLAQTHATWQDEHTVYLLEDFVAGGSLFERLPLRTKEIKLLAAQLTLALECVHAKSFAHRDVKPENVLIEREGHVKLSGFSCAKKIIGRTYTLCGTPDYMAPEIIQNTGHTTAVDWWALGCLLYECYRGVPPFHDERSEAKVFERIVKSSSNLAFPDNVPRDGAALIRKLLQRELSKRYGNMKGGVQDIKKHDYFRSINWADVSACRLSTAGLKPKLGDGGGDEASAHPPVEPLAVDRWENAMPLSLTKAEQALFEAW